MTLLQDVSISTAAVVCARAILTQLVTDAPDLTVIIVWAIEQTAMFWMYNVRDIIVRVYTNDLQLEHTEITQFMLPQSSVLFPGRKTQVAKTVCAVDV